MTLTAASKLRREPNSKIIAPVQEPGASTHVARATDTSAALLPAGITFILLSLADGFEQAQPDANGNVLNAKHSRIKPG